MILVMLSVYFLPKETLIQAHGKLPLLGDFMNLTILLLEHRLVMHQHSFAACGSGPDRSSASAHTPVCITSFPRLPQSRDRISTVGWILETAGNNYSSIFIDGPIFMATAHCHGVWDARW